MRYHYSRNACLFYHKTDISTGNRILGHEHARGYLGGFGVKLPNLAEFPTFLIRCTGFGGPDIECKHGQRSWLRIRTLPENKGQYVSIVLYLSIHGSSILRISTRLGMHCYAMYHSSMSEVKFVRARVYYVLH